MRASRVANALLAATSLTQGAAASIIRGVNLGGWLVTEPWMTPSLFAPTNTSDEWSLCNALGKDKCLSTLQDHWTNFYTHDDFTQIKKAGLTAVRIPLGYWAIDLLDYEPYVSGQYPHLVNAVQWANELGLKVFIDLHGAPGSQNGWEESGLVGAVAFGANKSNTDRSLNVLKNLTTEFTKEQYGGAVTNIELLNEPLLDYQPLRDFYTLGADVVGAGNSSGINVTIHDGFFQPHSWTNYDPYNPAATSNARYVTLDTHQFWAFPPLDKLSQSELLDTICAFGQQLRKPENGFLPTLVGEWSLSTGVTSNSTSNTEQDQAKRTWFRRLFEAQNAAFTPSGPGQSSIGWYFWAWKTEYDIDAWSYRKGLADGYIPQNISDPKSLVFPIMDNGCIDKNFTYEAPKYVAPSATASSSGAHPTKSSSTAPGVYPGSWLALVSAIFFGVAALA